MLNSLPIRLLWRSLNWLSRLLIIAAVMMGLAIVVLRYWLLPDIEQYHSQITRSLAEVIGHPVAMGRIEGDWKGWRPHLGIADVRILDERGQPALVLQNIDASVSWMSLLTADLRLASLEIDKPELLVRRDAQGGYFLGGVAFSSEGSDNTLADWLLRQSRIVVRDALIVWVDEQRDAPPLVLQKVNLNIESLFSHHRFALHALPPQELATPLDVRGDFYGDSFDEPDAWHGQVFTRLDYTDMTAWRPWLEFPDEFRQGRGALRGWLGVERGGWSHAVADLDLRDTVVQFSADTPEMAVLNLRGRAEWRVVPGGMEVSTRKLQMKLQNGIELPPTDFYFRSSRAIGGKPAEGQMRTNLLNLEKVAGLAKFLPLETGLRERLDAFSPSGKVSGLNVQWQGAMDKPDNYKIKGQFENIAVHQAGDIPGFSGLTADVDASDAGGRLNISSHQLVVDAPGLMREALLLDILTGQIGWRIKGGDLTVEVDNVAVANDDLSGNMYGSYRARAGTPGLLDLTARLTRGDISRAARYIPLTVLHREGSDWLNGALLAGYTDDLSIRIKGNLGDFPVRQETQDMLFKIGGHARGVVLEFAGDWPRIENINGEFQIRGNRLEVIVPAATMAGAQLQNVRVAIPDLTGGDLALEINGEAVAGNDTFLKFIQNSPVRGYISGSTDGMRATGSGHLTLYTRIPLAQEPLAHEKNAWEQSEPEAAAVQQNLPTVRVSGNFRMKDSDIDLGEGVPLLRKTGGVLTFTETGMQTQGVQAEILGGPAYLNVQTANHSVHAVVQGRCNLDALPRNKALPLMSELHGSAAYKADINVASGKLQILIDSDLAGISSTLPQPLVKHAGEAMPLHVNLASIAEGQDRLNAQLGSLVSVWLERGNEGGEMAIKRGTVNFGAQAVDPEAPRAKKRPREKDGVWITGNLPVLSVQGWGDLTGESGKSGKSGAAFPIAGVSMSVEKLVGYGLVMDSLQIEAARRGDGFAVQLAGDALSGEVLWSPRGDGAEGKFSAHLGKLHLAEDKQAVPSAKPVEPVASAKPNPAGMFHPADIPALDIIVDSLQFKSSNIGHFELAGSPDGQDWRLRRLNIANPDGSLNGDGVWRAMPGGTQSQINLLLGLADAGKTLARYGYPDTVKGGSGKLAATLSWNGTPDKFNYATLNGTLKLDTGKGRFLKMDPGAGKLLSILSLQALPKRIALDFDDVFSTGFEFDNIEGKATIRNGVIDTRDLHIDGSAARVTMKGNVDLNRETQNMRVTVLPSIGSSVSLGMAFAAGPVVGVGALIINKVLGDPLDNLVSFEYNVDGTWSNPNVVKINRPPAPLPE